MLQCLCISIFCFHSFCSSTFLIIHSLLFFLLTFSFFNQLTCPTWSPFTPRLFPSSSPSHSPNIILLSLNPPFLPPLSLLVRGLLISSSLKGFVSSPSPPSPLHPHPLPFSPSRLLVVMWILSLSATWQGRTGQREGEVRDNGDNVCLYCSPFPPSFIFLSFLFFSTYFFSCFSFMLPVSLSYWSCSCSLFCSK